MNNIEKYKRVIAIGDIHGCYNTLIALIDKIDIDFNNDLVIFLGDYIDRGKYPLEVLLKVKELSHSFPDNVVALKGNHEDMMIRYVKYGDRCWFHNGFESTNDAIANKFDDDENLIYELIDWCENLKEKFEIGRYRFCHSGQWDEFDVNERGYSSVLWDRDWLEFNAKDEYNDNVTIFGHTPFKDVAEIKNLNKDVYAIDIDTGAVFYNCFNGAKLSSIIIDTKSNNYEFLSVNTVKSDK